MSLDYSFGDIEGWKDLVWVEKAPQPSQGMVEGETTLNPVTESLIWSTMAIGMNKITEKNWEEFAIRMEVLQVMRGARLTESSAEGFRDRFITPEEIHRHVGLYTNADTLTGTAFKKRMIDSVYAEAGKKVEKVKDGHEAN